jgi:hypothetical protein
VVWTKITLNQDILACCSSQFYQGILWMGFTQERWAVISGVVVVLLAAGLETNAQSIYQYLSVDHSGLRAAQAGVGPGDRAHIG